MSQTPRLSMPYIMPSQAQKHVTHNEAIELLDAIVQLSLEALDVNAPPVGAAEGQAWAIGDSPTEAWSGQGGKIACWRGGGWMFVTPTEGWCAWVVAVGELHVFAAGQWVVKGQAQQHENLPFVGINATADATNRLTVASDTTLLTHDGAGHRVVLNKASAADTASLVFQNGYGGRAEFGLAGTDDFSIKVSDDGANWTEVLRVAAATGTVSVSQMLRLAPALQPAQASAGDIYFDSATAKLRCFDGAIWHDLFA